MKPNPPVANLLVRLCCLSGLAGSLLFLTGDMLFYGSTTSGSAFHVYQEMANRSVTLLVVGGELGPIAALFSAFGMGIFYLTLAPAGKRPALLTTILLAIMILIGGSYHAVFTNFGFAAKVADETSGEGLHTEVATLWNALSYPMYAAGAAGTALAFVIVLCRKTHFPRWLLLFFPTILSLASSVFRTYFVRIPAPLGGILRGGWINGTFVVFFMICTFVFWRLVVPRQGRWNP